MNDFPAIFEVNWSKVNIAAEREYIKLKSNSTKECPPNTLCISLKDFLCSNKNSPCVYFYLIKDYFAGIRILPMCICFSSVEYMANLPIDTKTTQNYM